MLTSKRTRSRVSTVALAVAWSAGCAELDGPPVVAPRPALTCEWASVEMLRYAVFQDSDRDGCTLLFLVVDPHTQPPIESIQNGLRVSGVRDPFPGVLHIDGPCETAILTPFAELQAVSVDIAGGFVAVTSGPRVDEVPPSLTLSASIDFTLATGETDTLRIEDFVLRDRDRGVAHAPCPL